MAVPKRKTSKARRDSRRSSVWKLTPPLWKSAPTAVLITCITEFAPSVDRKTAKKSSK